MAGRFGEVLRYAHTHYIQCGRHLSLPLMSLCMKVCAKYMCYLSYILLLYNEQVRNKACLLFIDVSGEDERVWGAAYSIKLDNTFIPSTFTIN